MCPQMRLPTTSFADKNSVQRLAADVLPNQPHVTAFNVQVRCSLACAAGWAEAVPCQLQRWYYHGPSQHHDDRPEICSRAGPSIANLCTL
jgi:hypothetical protein